MPYKDPEIRRARAREYSLAHYYRNREALLAHKKELRQENPERYREYDRRDRENNRETRNAYTRAHNARRYAANAEEINRQRRAYRQLHADEVRKQDKEKYWNGGRRKSARVRLLKSKHGMTPEDLQEIWDAQQGLCYLCGRPLVPGYLTHGADQRGNAAIDHDHSCCPAGKTCAICRRGLACSNCNTLAGLADDDPSRLRQIADSLEIAQAAVQKRKSRV